ncbi:MAG: 4-hydroxy-tetrahydrodipicolinate reductase [Flavobacteriia bacterium]|nr:4-hydroxy-tetrahydrodipicolinate reductase [Flavobacteriia bacterium]
MNIALIGYGKMGKTIERIAIARGHQVTHIYDSNRPFLAEEMCTADVAIEFTTPELVLGHISKALSMQLPIVVGTTGWNEHLSEVSQWVCAQSGSLLHASNFSLGVHIFQKICAQLAQVLSNFDTYTLRLDETHHIQKLDAPSGTAITLAESIIAQHSSLTHWELNKGDGLSTLPVFAHRVPDVPGTHTLTAQSSIDTISLTHTAHNREGFALGAVLAAEYLHGKKGLFTMSDVLNFTQ